MATAIRRTEPAERARPRRRARGRRLISPLTWRILAINLIAPALLVVGLLYVDQYRAALVEAQVQALFVQGELMSGALGESAVVGDGAPRLDADTARLIVRRLALATDTRVRLFDENGELLADSRYLMAAGREVTLRPLPPPQAVSPASRFLQWLYDAIVPRFTPTGDLPPYVEIFEPTAADYEEAVEALDGEPASAVRDAGEGALVVSIAVPVQGLRRVVGALLLSTGSAEIDERVRDQRLNILKLFGLGLVLTVLLSLFLAGTIARPVRRLAGAAEQATYGQGRRAEIPDFTRRRDEIGDLSGALRDMTERLYRRLDAIESFAADVAHEIKNPLTSLRSAVETIGVTRDPVKQQRLLDIIADDVNRLDRLISDISDASRLDAELSRAESGPVDLHALLGSLVEAYRETARTDMPRLSFAPAGGRTVVRAAEDRIGQVVRNLIANAASFSPVDGVIRIATAREPGHVLFSVADQGPGIPDDKLEAIFERFYSERPAGEAFGTHSGLGLSISRQIVEAYDGSIRAENLRGPDGAVAGARFTVRLPAG